ncbi:S26 family signal peptidase [Haloarcula salinisoli]|uniref:S26 family signal peptidase n=1 Tax=Haloarcula salinisoli TaxID=2487746 RepID=A0A8J7YID6_9EURY|nr:S26 family signal peptidase [Halomicroarcula salinisoli]MBX0286757.1 S26 family signal peptidase [Halomicroarcula salinisoli]MBX0304068.1 S26 family signal peptidase [Halomicroarcula salinisoli]
MNGADESASSDGEPPQSVQYGLDILGSAGTVFLVGLLVLAVSGIWPPLVAIESGSMEPQMERGDMVFVMAEERFAGPGARDGVVTAATAESSGYNRFGRPGDVIVFAPNGSDQRTPIIHRAMFYVEAGEKWYSRADPEYIGDAENCEELTNCPAKHEGFITKGDANGRYDQVQPIKSTVVRPRWVIGTAELRAPGLGWVRLSGPG